MELSINSLLARTDDFLFEKSSQAYRSAAGLEPWRPRSALHAANPEFSDPEVLHSVRELLESPRADEARRGRLKLLYTFLVGTFVEARTAQHGDALELHLAASHFSATLRSWTPAEALRELPRQSTREARELLERALSGALLESEADWARRTDALLHVTGELGLESPAALVELLQGRSLAKGLARAQDVLRQTEDAYGDLLSHALKRVEPSLRPGQARLHDAQRAANAPWLSELLRREDLEHAVTRCLDDLGLPPNASGRIAIDAEPRPGKSPTARVFALRVPDEVRLMLTPDAGFETWAGWLGAWGQAQHRALVSRTTPFVERSLGDQAVPEAVGLLFSSFLMDEGWLRRYVRLPSAQAVEVARLFAFRQTFQLRREAALLGIGAELLARGPVAAMRDEVTQRLQAALRVFVPAGRLVLDAAAEVDSLWKLDAWALESLLHLDLRERFNEDYWRNPATGRWLSNFAQHGQRDDAEAIARAMGHEGLPVTAATRRRVAIMGA